MNQTAMIQTHQATPWAWTLPARQATTLQATATPRWLRVEEGCVWLTAHQGDEPAQDIWLCAGQSLALAAGTAWVMEAWPQARLSLLLAGPVAASRGAAGWRAWRVPSLGRRLGSRWRLRLPLRFA